MDFAPILNGLRRVLSQDQLAVLTVTALALFQFILWVAAYLRTRFLLEKATENLQALGKLLSAEQLSLARIREAVHRSYPDFQRAWGEHLTEVPPGLAPKGARVPEEAFTPDALLPRTLNWRLDAAAPGLFTGIGILGTFIGLIFGFLRVDPQVASESVSPLLGGMVVAFVNSALGVALSLRWSWISRVKRHQFDTACLTVLDGLHRHVNVSRADNELLGAVGALAKQLDTLASATKESSDSLAGVLGARLETTFANLVNAPFDRLVAAVDAFATAMQESGAQQERMQATLAAGTTALDEARARITDVVREVRSVLDDLGLAGLRLQEAVNATQVPLERAGAIAAQTGEVVLALGAAASRYEQLSNGLVASTDALSTTSQSLDARAGEFAAATGRLEAAVTVIHSATERAVGETVSAAREELQVAIASFRDGLQIESNRTIQAYEAATGRVVEAVDNQMTDLTERLSAELATLTSRLPAQVEQVHTAMKLFREQIASALKSIDEAVKQLRQETPEVLSRQLDQYDTGLAKAMDHFSGTLASWNGHVESIAGLTHEIGALRQAIAGRDGRGATT